jgi:hypothetical protein
MASHNNTITANNFGLVRNASGVINSFGTNQLDGNLTDGTFNAPIIAQE